MALLVQEFRTLISANLHFLVDKALQSQSLSVIDEYIRNMTRQMRELQTLGDHPDRLLRVASRSRWHTSMPRRIHYRYSEAAAPIWLS